MVKKLSLLLCLLFLTTYLVQAETIKVPNEGTYVGSWKEGLKDGIGTLTYIDGSKYAGAFKDNKIHGYGSFTSSSGSNYTGEYKEGKMDGQGTYTYPDGKKITGKWANDSPAK